MKKQLYHRRIWRRCSCGMSIYDYIFHTRSLGDIKENFDYNIILDKRFNSISTQLNYGGAGLYSGAVTDSHNTLKISNYKCKNKYSSVRYRDNRVKRSISWYKE